MAEDWYDVFANSNNDKKYEGFEGFELTFDDFWQEVEEFAKAVGLHSSYVEEEFIIDGEFIPVFPPTENE